MLFNSISFVIFLSLVFGLYWLIGGHQGGSGLQTASE
jgi:hypothetical protein